MLTLRRHIKYHLPCNCSEPAKITDEIGGFKSYEEVFDYLERAYISCTVMIVRDLSKFIAVCGDHGELFYVYGTEGND